MLVASIATGFFAPIAAQASDSINLEAMNGYKISESSETINDVKSSANSINEELSILKARILELEARQLEPELTNDYEAGGFSDTTTLDGKTVFTIGSVETEDDVLIGEVLASYTYQLNLNTSFNGDDNLYVRLKSGNHDSWSDTKSNYNTYLSAANGNDDVLEVDKIWYTTPITDNQTIWIGGKIENYYMHGTTPSIYKPVLKAFTLGGNASAYGASTSPGAGWAYNADNGFAVSSNFTSQSGNTTGLLTDESKTSWATQLGYTQPQYSLSAIVNVKSNGWTDSYFRSAGNVRPPMGVNDDGDAISTGNSTNIGLRGWWRPESTGTALPSISVGYDTSDTEDITTSAYFLGLTWQDILSADDRIGLAFGQPQKVEDDPVDPFLFELYYDYKVNDSITVTPAVFGGTSNDGNDGHTDMTGYVINTTYKF